MIGRPGQYGCLTHRRWAKFGIRSLLCVVAFLSVWLAIQVNRVHRQEAAVAAITKYGGSVRYDWQPTVFGDFRYLAEGRQPPNSEPTGPEWARQTIGNAYFQRVASVDLSQPLWEADDVSIDDSTIELISSLRELEELFLTGITDDDLKHVGRLHNLRILVIRDNPISDRGLDHLHSLRTLEQINIIKTKVTDDGVAKLRKALPNCLVHTHQP